MSNTIQLGICAAPEQAAGLKDHYDYLELAFSTGLAPLVEDADFAETMAMLKDLPMPVRACNNFVAPQVKLVGPAVEQDTVRRYLERGFSRAEALGVERVVFGSGGARRVPESFSREAAWEQLVAFCRLCSEYAYPGLVIAIEPLNQGECNILNTFVEGLALARDVDRPNVGILADIYHMELESEPVSVLPQGADILAHVHLADSGRLYPGSGSYPLREMFAVLHENGYRQRASVECRWGDDFYREAALAAAFLRPLM
ncbi:MAG: sugar phosphate isomerase/epimerase family protein [Anaerolineae bacterium]|jgi:sugar phosphate isomerase/epimerase|nr:sugar phosphate isomerase/epimerase [Chloroflexota bacterium]